MKSPRTSASTFIACQRTEKVTNHDSSETWQANNNLLPLRDYAQAHESEKSRSPAATTPGASKHEPYI